MQLTRIIRSDPLLKSHLRVDPHATSECTMVGKPLRRVAVAIDMNWPGKHNVDIVSGIQRYARENENWEYHLDPFVRTLGLDKQAKGRYDAVVGRIDEDLNQRLIAAGVPGVNTSNYSAVDCSRVVTDFSATGRMAAEHLMARGLKRFGYLGYKDDPSDVMQEKAFCEDLTRNGFSCDTLLIDRGCMTNSDGFVDVHEILTDWVAGWTPPIGIFVSLGMCSRYLVDICRHQGFSAPGEGVFLGSGNKTSVCMNYTPTDSAIGRGCEQNGYLAAELLDHLMDGGLRPEHPVLVKPEIAWEQPLTDVLNGRDPLIVAALSFISEKCGRESIGVDDVAAAMSVNRRTLERHFRKELDSGVHEEISRSRIELVKHRLIKTEDSITSLAERLGFEDAKQLTELFRRIEGVSPSQYRLDHGDDNGDNPDDNAQDRDSR